MSDSATVTVVQLDGLVLLKMINHARDCLPESASGQLLGLDTGSTLEITSSFPMPLGLSSAQEETYQLEMMKSLRGVNVDTNTVGWYQISMMGSFLTSTLIEAQHAYQKHIPNSVVLIYDPLMTQRGHLSIRAYRLSEKFMAIYEKSPLTQELFTEGGIESPEIFEELPIQIHNSHLIHGFLYELRESKSFNCDDDRLALQHTPYIERAMNAALFENVDEFINEQNKYQYYQRSLTRQKQSQQAFISKLTNDNEIKQMQGKQLTESEQILNNPEMLAKHPLFKPIPKLDRLNNYLALAQISEGERLIREQSKNVLTKFMIVDSVHRPAVEETKPAKAQ